MNKKIYFIPIVLLIIILLVGCAPKTREDCDKKYGYGKDFNKLARCWAEVDAKAAISEAEKADSDIIAERPGWTVKDSDECFERFYGDKPKLSECLNTYREWVLGIDFEKMGVTSEEQCLSIELQKQGKTERCYAYFAIKNLDISICAETKKIIGYVKSVCAEVIAKETNDESICLDKKFLFLDERLSFNCYEYVRCGSSGCLGWGEERDNLKSEWEIRYQGKLAECEKEPRIELQDACYLKKALDNQDPHICTSTYCMESVIILSNNKDICKKIDYENIYKLFGVKVKNVEECENAIDRCKEDPNSYKFCKPYVPCDVIRDETQKAYCEENYGI